MLGPFDVALFALKAYHTQPAIEGMAAYAERLPVFLCLQNGVENEAALAKMLGEGKVIAASVTTAIARRAAGDVVLERLRGLGISGGHPLSTRLVEAFNTAGLNARLYPRAADMKWSKMLTNLIANASSAILDMTPAEIFAHPQLFQLEMRQLRECLAMMQAKGLRVANLPGTPVRALAFAVKSLPTGLSRPLLARAIGGGRGGKMPSFHIDLHGGGGRSEVDYLNGAVARTGEELGIDTPVNRFLRDTLLALTEGKIPLDRFRRKPAELLKQFGS
jgi:2-dehydropantoate 2-reductase